MPSAAASFDEVVVPGIHSSTQRLASFRELAGLTVSLSVVGLLTTQDVDGARRTAWWHDPDVQRHLGLTSAQVASIATAFRNTLTERRRLGEEQRRLEDQLEAVLRDANLSEVEEERLVKQVTSAQARRKVYRTMTLFHIYRILTPVQRAELRRLKLPAP